MKTAVVCWLWSQPHIRTPFSADHVNIFAAMVRRHCTLDIEIACVTDMPEGIDPSVRIIAPPGEFEDISLPNWPGFRPQCLRRMSMFRPDAADVFGTERICSLDLDCVIANSIDHIVGAKEDIRICQGTAAGRLYNGSIMLLTAGARPRVYEALTQDAAREASESYIGSDQAWLAHIIPGERTFGLEDGVMMVSGFRPRNGAICFYPGEKKPWHFVEAGKDKWVLDHYRADPRGRAVYRDNLKNGWADPGEFDAVFVSREAVFKPVKALVDDAAHAGRLAAMLGYSLAA